MLVCPVFESLFVVGFFNEVFDVHVQGFDLFHEDVPLHFNGWVIVWQLCDSSTLGLAKVLKVFFLRVIFFLYRCA